MTDAKSSVDADEALRSLVNRVIANEAAGSSNSHTREAVELLVLIRDGTDSIALVNPEPDEAD